MTNVEQSLSNYEAIREQIETITKAIANNIEIFNISTFTENHPVHPGDTTFWLKTKVSLITDRLARIYNGSSLADPQVIAERTKLTGTIESAISNTFVNIYRIVIKEFGIAIHAYSEDNCFCSEKNIIAEIPFHTPGELNDFDLETANKIYKRDIKQTLAAITSKRVFDQYRAFIQNENFTNGEIEVTEARPTLGQIAKDLELKLLSVDNLDNNEVACPDNWQEGIEAKLMATYNNHPFLFDASVKSLESAGKGIWFYLNYVEKEFRFARATLQCKIASDWNQQSNCEILNLINQSIQNNRLIIAKLVYDKLYGKQNDTR